MSTVEPMKNSIPFHITTANGVIAGSEDSISGIRSFKGIPFAAPPVGQLRWQPPHPVSPWQGVYDATHFGPRAMQLPVFGDMAFRSNGMSEDCLYLNVWTPTRSETEALPVLLYFYGGGHIAGDGSEPRYDGAELAQQGIIVLTANYRLNIFGFFAHPDLSQESPYHASGNYGLLDQVAALQWVHENIAAFGGDPRRITIAGESAGSMSVSALMASPLSKGLIAGAIGSSGALIGRLGPVPLAEAEAIGMVFGKNLGATNSTALRAIPAQTLLNATVGTGVRYFPPVIDGYFLPSSLPDLYAEGEQAQVPLLVGWNSEEMNYEGVMGRTPPTASAFRQVLNTLYGDHASEALKVYPTTTDDEAMQSATDLAGDRFIGYSTWKWATLHHKTGNHSVYRYLYAHPRPPMTPAMGNAVAGLAGGVLTNVPTDAHRPTPPRGAVHSADIEYFMGTLATNPVYAWTEEDYQMSNLMQSYYANFVKSGDPNHTESPIWLPIAELNGVPVMYIDIDPHLEIAQNEARYEFLEHHDI
jgi:para-nitrobenzyl esterase